MLPQDTRDRCFWFHRNIQDIWPAVQGWKKTEDWTGADRGMYYYIQMKTEITVDFKTDLASLEILMDKIHFICTWGAEDGHGFDDMNQEIKDAVIEGRTTRLYIIMHPEIYREPTLAEFAELGLDPSRTKSIQTELALRRTR
jgi:hypothetical protein